MPKCIILCGTPCSGKSTWSKKQGLTIVSCDDIRLTLFGKNYRHNPKNEESVWKMFDYLLSIQTEDFIVDNTNCKVSYINYIINHLPENYTYQIKFFDISLNKAKFRNILRYIKTGKWIPIKILEQFYKNYKKLNKKDYEKYILH